MKPILLGMNNPVSSDPAHALYPYPSTCTGARLLRFSGLEKKTYMTAFERRNRPVSAASTTTTSTVSSSRSSWRSWCTGVIRRRSGMQHSQAPGTEERALSDVERVQRQIMWQVRDMGDEFVGLLDQLGQSRELSLARTRLEEAVMWATKGITGSSQPPVAEPSIRRILLDIYDRIAAAVAAMKSGDTSALQEHVTQIDAHLSQLDQSDTDEETRLTTIETGIAKIANAASPPAAAGLTVSPTALTGTAGQALTGSLSVSGGTAPYSFSSSLGDISVGADGGVIGSPAAAEQGTITVSDSSTPPLTASVSVIVSPADPTA